VTPTEIEQAVSRTSAQYLGDLRTMLVEVGKDYESQLLAKDQALAAKDETIASAAAGRRWPRRHSRRALTMRRRKPARPRKRPTAPEASPVAPIGSWVACVPF
jgi:hypothetical protein